MLRNAGSNGVGQQARSVAASTPASDGAEEATTATKKAENVSPLSVVVGAVALGVSLLKLVIWLVTPAHPTYQPVGGSPRAGDLSHSLPACELVFPGGQGAIPGINCFKYGGNKSDIWHSDIWNKAN